MIAELSWKVRPWVAVLESHARNQPERSTDRGEAAIRDDCRASWKVRPGMAVLESHARNQPERSTDRGEAAIRDDCRASWKVRPGMAVLEPYARNGRGRRIAATEQRSGTIAPIPPGRDARTKSVPGRDRRR